MASDGGNDVAEDFIRNPEFANDDAENDDFFGTQLPDDTFNLELPDIDRELSRPAINYEMSPKNATSADHACTSNVRAMSDDSSLDHLCNANSLEITKPFGKRRGSKSSGCFIPNGAEIINVDSVDLPTYVPAVVKTEDPDVVILAEHTYVHVKQEPGDGKFDYWNFSEESIDLSSDGEHEGTPVHIQRLRSQSPQTGASTYEQPTAETSQQDVPISRDPSITRIGSELGGTSSAKNSRYKELAGEDFVDIEVQSPQRAVASDIEITHEEDVPRPENVSRPGASNAPAIPLTLKAGLSILKSPNPKAKHTGAQIAKMFEIQKILAERARKGPKVAAAGAVSHSSPAMPLEGQPSSSQDTEPIEKVAVDPHAWMHDRDDLDDEEEDPNAFAEMKRKYKAKARLKMTSYEEDIAYMRAEHAENARLKRLGADKEHFFPNRYDEEDKDTLFVNQDQTETKKRKHLATNTAEDNNNNNNNNNDYDSADERRERYLELKERRNRIPDDELEFSMLAGMEMDLSKDRKASRKEKYSRKATESSKVSGKGKGSKGKAVVQSTGRTSKGKGRGKAKKDQIPKKRVKPTHDGYMVDVNSMFNNNVYTAANANLELEQLPVITETKKNEALKALLASVPVEDRKAAASEGQHILRATKTLAKRKVKPDGNGRWKLKGMATSLMNHQVQGAAWMRERETGDVQPLGGLCADEMGFGKTVMMIANMIANPPKSSDACRSTLIVATPALCTQWIKEVEKHSEKGIFPIVTRYKASANTHIEHLRDTDVVLTTYAEVLKSYPSTKVPKELVTREDKDKWWKKHYEEKKGQLHQVYFYRIVLDEAQAIKNYQSQTSIACRGLTAKHRWALSGTPILNNVQELYPYFKFLHVPHTGNLEIFKENFCDRNSPLSTPRLHVFLQKIMIRRTYLDTLFGAPLIDMPKNTQQTVMVEFNQVERTVYDIVRHRYIQKINSYVHQGLLEKRYNNVLTMLLRLRQLTAHILMLQGVIEDLIQFEDIERLWEATATEVTPDGGEGRDMLVQMKRILNEKDATLSTAAAEAANEAAVAGVEEAFAQEETPCVVFKFRKYLRTLAADKSRWNDLKERSTCHKCGDAPDDPWVTSCLHLYCQECLFAMASEAAENDEDSATCLECGAIYTEAHPCNGLKELGSEGNVHMPSASSSDSNRTRRCRKNCEKDEEMTKWVDLEGQVLPSSKVAALIAQVDKWLKEKPDGKIIIFTQFHVMIKIIGRVCRERSWGYRTYHGKMNHQARDNAIDGFRDEEETKILIASLKCGGVGLNLTMASKVICIDLWWNSSVEQQAFCRIFRIGQQNETYITRFVVKNTVDEKLLEMQEDKKEQIEIAMGDSGPRRARLSIKELMRLFGTVQEDENHKPFILVQDEHEFDEEMPDRLDDEEANSGGFASRK